MPRVSAKMLGTGALFLLVAAYSVHAQVSNWQLTTQLPGSTTPGFDAQSVWASSPSNVFIVGGVQQIDHFGTCQRL